MAPIRIQNPPNPYHSSQVEWIDAPPDARLEVYEEDAKSFLSENKSPDIGFRFSGNPYRGCFHGCAYCYARPSHQYLDFGAGTDFERKIVVKTNCHIHLRRELTKPSVRGHAITFSGNTDCYQPLELSYELTRKCLAVCADFSQPVIIISKGALIQRDIDILQELHRKTRLRVMMSIAFADDDMSRRMEPGAPRPSTRFRAMAELGKAGIPLGLALAPVIPGLNDRDIAQLLTRAKDCGAECAFMTMVRLPREVKDIFVDRVATQLPSHLEKVVHRIKEMRGGSLNNSQFGARMVGTGAHWDAIEWLFQSTCDRLQLSRSREDETILPRRIMTPGRAQLTLDL